MQPFCVRRACIYYEQLYEFQISFSQPMQPIKMTLDRYIFCIWPAWLPIDETENLPIGRPWLKIILPNVMLAVLFLWKIKRQHRAFKQALVLFE
jgi:hypothetical protein